ncbi:MAG: hypothetical protein ACREB9_01925 [Thermoplasmata archaeon]
MSDLTERSLAYGFGLIGGVLMIAAALVSAVFAIIDFAVGHPSATGPMTAAVVLFVLGGLVLFFSYLGQREWRDRPLASGIVLVVLAAIGLGALGFGANVIALVGAIFALVAGVLFLIEPAIGFARTAKAA